VACSRGLAFDADVSSKDPGDVERGATVLRKSLDVTWKATGQDSEAANWVARDVKAYQGQQAQIQAVDQNTGGWGHLLLDNIVFSTQAAVPVSTETAVNLLVGGNVVRTATGSNDEALDWVGWDVRGLAGQQAQLQLIDNNTGGWGHVTADQFTLADVAAQSTTQRAHWMDYGRDFYAAASYNNLPVNQRTVIAWMNNWDYAGNIPTSPWRSAMSVPRHITLETVNGKVQLVAQPVNQLQSLRRPNPYKITDSRSVNGTTTLTAPGASGDTVEIIARFAAKGAQQFGLNVRVGGTDKTVVGYDVTKGGHLPGPYPVRERVLQQRIPQQRIRAAGRNERNRHAASARRSVLR
jgi:fructan beta-fructosidase